MFYLFDKTARLINSTGGVTNGRIILCNWILSRIIGSHIWGHGVDPFGVNVFGGIKYFGLY